MLGRLDSFQEPGNLIRVIQGWREKSRVVFIIAVESEDYKAFLTLEPQAVPPPAAVLPAYL